MTALLAGATGLIGRELARLGGPGCCTCWCGRRPPAARRRSCSACTWSTSAALPALPAADEAYCCLGTTIKAAGSQAAFRAVDFDAVLAFAHAAQRAGVQRFAVVSALGASPRSPRLLQPRQGRDGGRRWRGWASPAWSSRGPRCWPATAPRWASRSALGERLALALTAPLAAADPQGLAARSHAATVARAMRRALAEARPGVRIVESAELQELGTMKIHFLGAADGVTGSRHLVDTGERQILLDCGLFQGWKLHRERNWQSPAALREVDAVVLSHAHLDHSGWLPALVKHGFRGPIHASPATCELARVLLLDSAHLQEEDARRANRYGYSRHAKALPLYTQGRCPTRAGAVRAAAAGARTEDRPQHRQAHPGGAPAGRLLGGADARRPAPGVSRATSAATTTC